MRMSDALFIFNQAILSFDAPQGAGVNIFQLKVKYVKILPYVYGISGFGYGHNPVVDLWNEWDRLVGNL